MTYSKEPSYLIRLPRELRDQIWALLAKSERADAESTRGIINCCRQTASEMASHIIPFDNKGGLENLTIRFDVTLVNNIWLTLDFCSGHYRRNFTYCYISCWVGPGWRIENMDNPILDAVRKATYITRARVFFGE
ncbi:hypothetical protein CMUS01_16152 [Colletotrichum musicola]|uniref:Uncharacterized protein n=1 Tax=Colletotrichum musicola TaxID=2175873 RepID=A0A8H6MKA2_9PEZI|nr:hypothetical protein CMUS01_16152 [Colletotrichum musicola]